MNTLRRRPFLRFDGVAKPRSRKRSLLPRKPTCGVSPGTVRTASPNVVTPRSAMSSRLTTWMENGVSLMATSLLLAVVAVVGR